MANKEEALTLEDAFEAAYATQTSGKEEKEEAETPKEEVLEDSKPDTEITEKDGDTDGLQVKEKGRQKEKEVAPSSRADTSEVAPPPQMESPKVEPPPFWDKKDLQVWDKLPADAKAICTKNAKNGQTYVNRIISQLNQEFHKQVGDWHGLNEVFTEDRLKTLRAEGLTPAMVTERWAGWQDALNTNPYQTIGKLLQTYNIAPQQFMEYLNSGEAQTFQGNQEIEDLKAELAKQKQDLEQKFSNQELTQIRTQIGAFGQEKDSSGKALRPFFEELKPMIRQLLPLIYEQNEGISDYDALHAAWERAAYADPAIREKLMAQTKAAQQKEAVIQAQNTKKAASSLVGTTSSPGTPRPKAKSVDEALEMAAEEHGISI